MRDRQFVSFQMGGHLFGVDILVVREIIRRVDYTPVEHAPEAVRGLLNLRGQIITVLDLGPTLGLPPRQINASSRCIILKTEEETAPLYEAGLIPEKTPGDAVGLLVDGISDVVDAEEGDMDAPPANRSDVEVEFLNGVIKLQDKLLLVLHLENLVNAGLGQAVGEA